MYDNLFKIDQCAYGGEHSITFEIKMSRILIDASEELRLQSRRIYSDVLCRYSELVTWKPFLHHNGVGFAGNAFSRGFLCGGRAFWVFMSLVIDFITLSEIRGGIRGISRRG